jgi:Mrp family chromosome partitioning ATPase
MSNDPPRRPFAPAPPRKGTAGQPAAGRGGPSETSELSGDLSAFFAEGAPAPAAAGQLVDADAATRVAELPNFNEPGGSTRIVESPFSNFGASSGTPAGGRPNLQGDWRGAATGTEAPTLTADALRAHLPMGMVGDDSTKVLPSLDPNMAQQGYGQPQGYYDPNQGYVVPGEVMDPNMAMMGGMMGGMPVPAQYGLVPAGMDPSMGGAMGGDPSQFQHQTWLQINPPEHIGQVSQDLVMMTHPDGFAAAQFRALRYRLEQESSTQILVVTSPRDGDGKSVTAANLALALAEGGRIQVLLIDASLRNPTQHRLFGINGELGLTTVLAARQDDPNRPVDCIGITRSLCLIPAGPPVASAHAALASESAAVLMGIIRQEFRYIVVDGSSVFGSAETLAWHGLIDKYILVARAGRTTTEDLSAACDQLHRDRILGVTFLGGKPRRK